MDAQRGFLEAVRESPEDDLHRLAWADWLDDHGQASRATFLRACVEASHLDVTSPRRAELEEEACQLLDRQEEEWLGPIADLALDWRWRRGCVERVTARASALLEAGDELLHAAPVRALRILGDEKELADLAGSPWLAKLEALDLGVTALEGEAPFTGYVMRGDSLWALLRSPHLGRARGLRLAGHDFSGRLVQQLMEAGWLARLRSLDLAGCHAFGNQAAGLLARCPAPHLESLNLLGTNLSDYGLREVLAAASWPRLSDLSLPLERGLSTARGSSERLALTNAPLLLRSRTQRVEGAMALWWLSDLAPAAELGPVRHLIVRGNSPASLRLEQWPGLANVRRLQVLDARLGDSHFRPLFESPHLKAVEWLDLSNNRAGGPALRSMMEAPGLAGLERLLLNGNHVGTHGAGLLARSPWRRLRSLSLDSANISPDALAALAGSPTARRLVSLRLNKNPLGDDGLPRLLEAGPLRLRELYVDECHLDIRSCRVLCDRDLLPHLRIVSARNNHFSAGEKDRLRERFGAGWVG